MTVRQIIGLYCGMWRGAEFVGNRKEYYTRYSIPESYYDLKVTHFTITDEYFFRFYI